MTYGRLRRHADLARLFASLDHLSGGRAGWNIVTTGAPQATAADRTSTVLTWYDATAETIAVAGAPTQVTNSRTWGIAWLTAGYRGGCQSVSVPRRSAAVISTTDTACLRNGRTSLWPPDAWMRTLRALPACTGCPQFLLGWN
ncbi:hypothetical protein [Streptomyces sp. NPDC000851]